MEDVVICFRDQSGDKVFFKVRSDINIRKLLKSYCKSKNLEYGTLEFLCNGERLPHELTVHQAGLKNDQEIDVLKPMGGGGGGGAVAGRNI